MLRSFRNLGIQDRLLVNLARQKILVPTEIQSNTFPHLSALDSGKNHIVLSETGSGKTLAYLLPTINRVLSRYDHAESPDADHRDAPKNLLRQRSPDTLVILPNSDLVSQVAESTGRLATGTPLKYHSLLHDGGRSGLESMRIPSGTDLLLTTFPALFHINHLLDDLFCDTRCVVVDEADLLLSGEGSPVERFQPRRLLERIQSIQRRSGGDKDIAVSEKQFVFVGATMPIGHKTARDYIFSRYHPVQMLYSSGSHQPVRSLTQQWIPLTITGSSGDGVDNGDNNQQQQQQHEILHQSKCRELFNLLREDRSSSSSSNSSDNDNSNGGSKILVFTNTLQSTEQTFNSLRSLLDNYPNLAASIRLLCLHSGMSKMERKRSLRQFGENEIMINAIAEEFDGMQATDADKETTDDVKNENYSSQTTVMIAGDVMARGFDFANVDRVVQFDFSTNITQYLHRVGRTARGGRSGEVINFIGPQDERLAAHIQQAIARNQSLSAEQISSVEDLDNVIVDDNSAGPPISLRYPVDKTEFARLFSRNRSLRKRDRRKAAAAAITAAA